MHTRKTSEAGLAADSLSRPQSPAQPPRRRVQNKSKKFVRTGRVSWLTRPPSGTARVESDTAAFHALPVVLPEDSASAHEATPGQLLALTHAIFLAAALSEHLTLTGVPANELVVEASCTFEGPITARQLAALDLHVCGRVPGVNEEAFRAAADVARRQALRSAGAREDIPGTLTSELHAAAER